MVSPATAQSSKQPSSTQGLPTAGLSTSGAGHLEGETIRQLNDYRASRGLSRLSVDPILTAQARGWSLHLANGGAFRHSDANVFENIAMHSNADAGTFFNQWRNSGGHDRNMLAGGVNKVGVGVAHDAQGKAYATMQLSR